MRSQALALERFGERVPPAVEAPAPNKCEDQLDRPVRSFDLRAMWLVAAHNRLLTTILLIVFAAGPVSFWLTKPVYSAQATIQIDPSALRISGAEKNSPDARRIEDERLQKAKIDLLASRSTARDVADKLNLWDHPPFLREVGLEDEPAGPARNAKVTAALHDRLSLSSAHDPRIVAVRFDSGDPALAARTANAFADTFSSDTLRRRLVNHDLALRFLRGQLEESDARVAQSERDLVNYARNEGLVVADPKTAGLAGKVRLGDLIKAYARAQARRKQALQRWLDVIAAPAMTNPVTIVQRAQVPAVAAYPSFAMNMALAALGVALALGVDIARTRMNEKIRSPRALEPASSAQLPAAPFPVAAHTAAGPLDDKVHGPADVPNDQDAHLLGVVPVSRDGEDAVFALSGTTSPDTAAHRAIFLALDQIVRAADHKVLLLTSSGPNEGTSTIALNLSANFAASGRKVLMIDTDLRRGSPSHIGLSNQPGLADLLAKDSTYALANVAQYRADRGFSVVSRGGWAMNADDLLAGRRFADLLDEAATLYDVVIIDGPPVLGLPDAPRLSGMADATLFVLQANRTSRQQARLAMRRLSEAGAGKIGLVISQYDAARDVGASDHGCSDDHAVDERGAFIAKAPPFASRAPIHLTIDEIDGLESGLVTQRESTQHGR